jgi:hypothetical protein
MDAIGAPRSRCIVPEKIVMARIFIQACHTFYEKESLSYGGHEMGVTPRGFGFTAALRCDVRSAPGSLETPVKSSGFSHL